MRRFSVKITNSFIYLTEFQSGSKGLLLVLSSFGGQSGLSFPLSLVLLVRTSLSGHFVSFESLFLSGWNTCLFQSDGGSVPEWHNDSLELRCQFDLFCSRITLMWLLLIEWEENEATLILFQSLNIPLNRFQTLVCPPDIHSDSDRSCISSMNSCGFQFLQRKSTTQSQLCVVS